MKMRLPDIISLYVEDMPRVDSAYAGDAKLGFEFGVGALRITLTADKTPVKHIRLRWNFEAGDTDVKPVRVYGDHWERGYGDMYWGPIQPERVMPWVCAASTGSDREPDCKGRRTECFGVDVRPGAICAWRYDAAGVTLWADVRCGGRGVLLGGRTLNVCTVRFGRYDDVSAYAALRDFYSKLCGDMILPPQPVYGFNNWYYAYGKSSHDDIMRDARWLAELCQGNENPPFMVIDDGWQPHNTEYPWDRGNERFPDMARLADEIKSLGVKPGIWIRYLVDTQHRAPLPDEARLSRDGRYLDPTHPAVIDQIQRDTRRIVDWGYQLIKHDYSTYDIFGDWGNRRQRLLTDDGWAFYDRTRTSAEIVADFYRTILEAADGRALILGCNVIGHLTAGLAHMNRTGDDTSGREWDRTRRMGPNTLAFRMLHDKTFYGADADCAAFTPAIDQDMGLRWLDALAKSGTALFVSPQPGALDENGVAALKEALRINSVQRDEMIPVDWMENTTPSLYLINGQLRRYEWFDAFGADT